MMNQPIVDEIVAAKLDEIRYAGGRYNNKGAFVSNSHDGSGFYVERGGMWNDSTDRALLGFTGDDLADVRKACKAAGKALTKQQAEVMLAKALHRGSERERVRELNAYHASIKAA